MYHLVKKSLCTLYVCAHYGMVTWEITLFQNYVLSVTLNPIHSLSHCPSTVNAVVTCEIKLFLKFCQHIISHVTTSKTKVKLFQPPKELGNYLETISVTMN